MKEYEIAGRYRASKDRRKMVSNEHPPSPADDKPASTEEEEEAAMTLENDLYERTFKNEADALPLYSND